MNRLTTDKPEGNYENALNLFYGKDWEVWVRGGGAAPEYQDVRLIDYIRDIARRFALAFTPEADDMTFAEETNDALLDGTDTMEGIVGTLHTAGWVCATLRSRLKEYEDTGLTPEEIRESDEMLRAFIEHNRATEYPRTLGWLLDITKSEADGRLIVLPCKVGDKVRDLIGNYVFTIEKIVVLDNTLIFKCGNPETQDYMSFDKQDIGERVEILRGEEDTE